MSMAFSTVDMSRGDSTILGKYASKYSDPELAPINNNNDDEPVPFYKTNWFKITSIVAACIIILIIIMIPITVKVIAPNIAQNSIKGSNMTIQSMAIDQPTANGFRITINGRMDNVSPMDAVMQETVMTMSYNGSDFATLTMPQMAIAGGQPLLLNFSTNVNLTNQDVYLKYSHSLVNSDSAETSLTGVVNIQVRAAGMWLSLSDIPFEKTMPMQGMKGLTQVEMGQMQLPRNDPNGIQLIASPRINNISPVSMVMGTPQFKVSYKGVPFAILTTENMILQPGWNNLTMYGKLIDIKDTDKDIMSEYFSGFISGQNSSVSVEGMHTDYNGMDIPWMNLTLQSLTMTSECPGMQNYSVIGDMKIESMSIDEPTEKGFRLHMIGSINNTSPMNAKMQQGIMTMKYKDIAFASFSMPPLDARMNQATLPLNFSTHVTLLDSATYIKFATDLVNSDNVVNSLMGILNIDINVGSNSWVPLNNVTINKNIPMQGMQGLSQVVLGQLELPRDVDGGIELKVSPKINNISPVSMAMGSPLFHVFYKNVLLAELRSRDMVLSPGWNTLEMVGKLLPIEPQNEDLVSEYFTGFMHGETSNLTVKGIYTDFNGKSVPWLNQTLQSLAIVSPCPGSSNYSAIGDMSIESMTIDFDQQDSFFITTSTNIGYSMPENIKFKTSLNSVNQTMQMLDKSGAVFAQATLSSTVVHNTGPNSATLVLQGRMTKLSSGFDDFLKAQMTSSMADFAFTGNSSVVIQSSIGKMFISNLPVKKSLSIKGMDIQNQQPTIGAFKMIKGTPNTLTVETNVIIQNPSTTSVKNMGNVQFQMFYTGTDGIETQLGLVLLPNFALSQGANHFPVTTTITLDPSKQKTFQEFFSNYGLGIGNNIRLGGFKGSTQVALLANVFPDISMKSTVPGQLLDLTSASYSYLFSSESTFDIKNPFDIPLTILEFDDLHVYLGGTKDEVSYIPNFVIDQGGLWIPPKGTSDQEVCIPAKPNLSKLSAQGVGIFELMSKSSSVDMQGTVKVLLGQFPITVQYQGKKVKNVNEYWFATCGKKRQH